jgi:hypothetical protein
VFLRAEEITVGAGDVDADQDGDVRLVDLVVGAEVDRGQGHPRRGGAGPGDGPLDDGLHAAQADRVVEQVGQQFDHAPQGTAADEHQAEDELLQPGLGDRQPEEDAFAVGGVGGEGAVEGLLRLVGLLVDELAADVVVVGEAADGLGVGEGVQGEVLAGVRGQQAGRRGAGRGRDRGQRMG